MKNFKNPKILKTALFLFITAAVFSLIGYAMVNRNKETIIDLGNGWKSYSHEEIGITAKIPAESKIEYEIKGDKKCCPTAIFSKGSVVSISSILYSHLPYNTYEKQLKEYRKKISRSVDTGIILKEDKNTGEILERDLFKEITIDGMVAFIRFTEEKNNRKGTHHFFINSIIVAGKTRNHKMAFRQFINGQFENKHPEVFYQQYPRLILKSFSDEDIERSMQSHIDAIKDLIVSIDNF